MTTILRGATTINHQVALRANFKMYSRSAKGGEKGDPNRNPWLAKMPFLQILLFISHQWNVIWYAPCRLQGAAFIQKIFIFDICTWENILLLRMKDLVFDINWNKYNNLWLTILNIFTRNLCLQFQEMFDWCWELEHQDVHDTRF